MSAREDVRDPLRLLALAGLLFSAALVLLMTVVPLADNDTWLLMKVGEIIVDTGKIPDSVMFAFTTVRDNHFNSHEWLVSVVLHELQRGLGEANLMWVVGVFAIVQFALCFVLARRQSGSSEAAVLLALLAMVCAHFRYVLRPEIFALLYLILLLTVLDRYRTERRWPTLLWTLALTLLWVNSHGSFLLAPAIAGIFAFGEGLTAAVGHAGTPRERLRAGWQSGWPYAAAMLAMLAVCIVNPAGWHILAFPFQLERSAAARAMISEWLPTFSPLFMGTRAFWIFLAVAVPALALVARLRRHLGATDAMLFALFLGLALSRNRHIVWFGFVALTVCARLISHVVIEHRQQVRLRLAAIGLALSGLAACTAFGNANHAHIYFAPSENLSPAMVAELANPAVKGRVLTSYELGCELIYRDWPRLLPSIDSRVDSYGDLYLLFHVRLMRDEKLLNLFLQGNRVNYMLLLRRDFENNIRNMSSIHANWHIRLATDGVFLLERNQPLPALESPQ
jgi:hypothetical protein